MALCRWVVGIDRKHTLQTIPFLGRITGYDG
jgi:hypothetical protein